MQHVIVNTGPLDPFDLHAPTFWSNEFGWVGIEDATMFTDAERFSDEERVHLPEGGVWSKRSEVEYFLRDDLTVHAVTRPCQCKGQCTGGGS